VAAPEAAEAAEAAEVEIAVVSPAWVRYAPFTLSGFLTVFFIAGFAWRIVSESHLDLRRLERLTVGSAHPGAIPLWLELVAVPAAVLVVVACASTIGYVLAFWGFRLVRRDGGSLQVTRGLLSTRAITIEERRLRG